ncbi:NADPH:quinone reductase [Dyadobacter koreensis]|uniref:NADPH:quinone reductase n=1 Tax=Dyadobacter koreensis TaxID=408657 RepID=A0A1H7B6Q6_9BACT|nr:zinc-binding alcohol dehydrogenase family protein [Dyadobacter koreensis]SEJ69960.1 NADPH:quinone reductase [Dyadobacter koreensis]
MVKNQLVLVNSSLSFDEEINIYSIVLEGQPLNFAIVPSQLPDFDWQIKGLAEMVLVEKIGFSCNYRDRAILLQQHHSFSQGQTTQFDAVGFGSEFVARVIQVGSGVTNLQVGDLVINSGSYPYNGNGGRPGLPTNSASLRYDVLHSGNLVKVPSNVSPEKLAGFTIGAITSLSMLEKLNLKVEDKILLTAATSNTALFVLEALRCRYPSIYVSSRSKEHKQWFLDKGVKKFICPENGSLESEISKVAQQIDGFDAIIDPFFDINVEMAVTNLRHFGRYITCGFFDQFHFIDKSFRRYVPDANIIFEHILIKNLVVFGNCLGLDRHLNLGIQYLSEGHMDVNVDSISNDSSIQKFLDRSFVSSNRLGKVIFMYD